MVSRHDESQDTVGVVADPFDADAWRLQFNDVTAGIQYDMGDHGFRSWLYRSMVESRAIVHSLR